MLIFLIALIIFIVVLCTSNDDIKQRKEDKREALRRQAGIAGEQAVKQKIQSIAPTNSKLINNVVLYGKNRKTYQIDHIFINTNGIWIIETKNWSGEIYGEELENDWFQVQGNHKERRFNPLQQNFTHCYKIQSILGTDAPINCLVVFIKADISNINAKRICNLRDLPKVLFSETGKKLTEKQIEYYYQKIIYYQNQCNISSEEHEMIMRNSRNKYAYGFCPNCGGRLKKRRYNSRVFYGCSNFPRCRYTQNKVDFFD